MSKSPENSLAIFSTSAKADSAFCFAMLASCWYWCHSPHATKIHCADVASTRYRAPDPAVRDNIIVRRFPPTTERSKQTTMPFQGSPPICWGPWAGNSLTYTWADYGAAIMAELDRFKQGLLAASAKKIADATNRDYDDYRKS